MSAGVLKREDKIVHISEIQEVARTEAKIRAIVLYRDFTGSGLIDSKEAIEAVWPSGSEKITPDRLVDVFRDVAEVDTLSREEIHAIVDQAIEAGESLFITDPFEAIKVAVDNIIDLGGAEHVVKKINMFITSC